jgi:hypothetical protein
LASAHSVGWLIGVRSIQKLAPHISSVRPSAAVT